MPSGSHGGGRGGSHGGFTGGFSRSSGGGGFSRPSSRPSHRPSQHYHGGHVHIGPRRFRWFGGRTVIITSGAQSALAFLAFFIVAAFLVMMSGISDVNRYNDHLNMIAEERQYYLSMIADAEEDSDLFVDAEVTGVYFDAIYEKYYITYSFGSGNYPGKSFAIYDYNEHPKKGSIIPLAVETETIDATTDSVPMDYKEYALEDDGEYLLTKNDIKNSTTRAVISGLVLVGCIGIVVIIFVKAKKEKEEEKAEEKAKEEKIEQEKIAAERKKFCQYCGAKIDANDKVCGRCGAGTQ